MGGFQHSYRASACPGCGKPDAARMGSSAWGHGMMCCGEACGLKVRDALAEMRNDDRFKFLTQMAHHACEQLGGLQNEYLADLRGDE